MSTPSTPKQRATEDIAKPVRTVAGLTLISRILGLARDAVLVRVLGDTVVGSAFNAAFAIPNLFRRLFGEGALAAAVVPVYSELAKNDDERRHAYTSALLAATTLATGLLTILLELLLVVLITTLPPEHDRDLSLRLMMIALPFMPLVCLAATMGGMLQVHGRFAPAAGAPIILNTCVLATAGWRLITHLDEPEASAAWISAAVVIAGALQAAWAAAELFPRVRLTRAFHLARTPTVDTLKRFLPAVIGMGTLQLSTVIDIAIAMWPTWFGPTMFGHDVPLDGASNAILAFTQRLYQFPLGLFGVAIATAAFPALSRAASDHSLFTETLAKGLRLSAFIAIPATFGLLLVGPDLTAVMFSGGGLGFSDDGLARSQTVLICYSLGLLAYSFNHLLVRAFHAQGDTTTPMRVGVVMLGINVTANLMLIWPLREAGLAASTALCAAVQCVVLATLLTRAGHTNGAWPSIASAVSSIFIRALVMAACVASVRFVRFGEGWIPEALHLSAMTAVGLIVFGALSWKRPEMHWLLSRSTQDD